MGRLKRLLKDLREEVERLGSRAPAAPGEVDPSRLDDAELARLDLLTRRARGEPVTTREQFLEGRPNHATWQRHWATNPGASPPPAADEVGPLSPEEEAELAALLEQARVPRPWQGEGDPA